MSTDVLTLCDRISALLAERELTGISPIADIERTLTDGYAQAHLLEAERRRVDRRIAKLAAAAEANADELAALVQTGQRTSKELARLRDLLRALRRHHAALQAA